MQRAAIKIVVEHRSILFLEVGDHVLATGNHIHFVAGVKILRNAALDHYYRVTVVDLTVTQKGFFDVIPGRVLTMITSEVKPGCIGLV